jgi:hypothetical protein
MTFLKKKRNSLMVQAQLGLAVVTVEVVTITFKKTLTAS